MKSHLPSPSQLNSDHNAKDDMLRQRCHAYLTGDMSESETVAFENDLADPAVANALERESRLLLDVVHQADALSEGVLLDASAPTRPHHSRSRAKVWCSILAIATALLAAVVYDHANTDSEAEIESAAPFDLAVAKSWLQPAIQWDSEDDVWSQDLVDFDNQTTASGPSDDSIAWMVAAVEVVRQTPEQNDG